MHTTPNTKNTSKGLIDNKKRQVVKKTKATKWMENVKQDLISATKSFDSKDFLWALNFICHLAIEKVSFQDFEDFLHLDS